MRAQANVEAAQAAVADPAKPVPLIEPRRNRILREAGIQHYTAREAGGDER